MNNLLEERCTLAELEQRYIVTTLIRKGGNLAATLRVLGIGRTTLYRKLNEYGIDPKDIRASKVAKVPKYVPPIRGRVAARVAELDAQEVATADPKPKWGGVSL